ncbi:sigma-70 family RNA polymerase sigma factor [Paenibacillus rhizovicinus]|uniref:RNA polymerase sigma factor n=2 Tax=Paenibacillus rhizovicinus TaxID=2704463 RepID=A0A6C0NY62_9BACL|nr:sigma-70 family RNA polymerase sigma factor [Paenibacillus rhizovicinus]
MTVMEQWLLEREPLTNGTGMLREIAEPESVEILVARARTGDSDAFGQLVRRSRVKAFGLAYSMTRDHHLAEDVVQEALVRAFLHLGTLMDSSRFAPWLARIIRNEAYMKLRRGGPHGKEQPLSSLGTSQSASHPKEHSNGSQWRDMDEILFRLTRSASESARQMSDPTSALLRKELLEGIRILLRCLSERERRIFEAHVFDQLPPQHIAALLDTSVANVYNSISRSRRKVQQERIRVHIGTYIEVRRAEGKPVRKMLTAPVYQ